MKLAIDPCLLRQLPVGEMFDTVARAGYEAVELSPRDGFLIHRHESRPASAVLREITEASSQCQVDVASIFVVQPWASTDADERLMAVRALRVAIETAAELGCPRINTEFTGIPADPQRCREAFFRSLDEVLPTAERHGVAVMIEPHPYDFVETNTDAVDLIRLVGSPLVRYLFCAPHRFHLGEDLGEMIDYCAPVLGHVHLADTYRPARVILNPPDPDARIHQHLDIGQGEVEWSALFASLDRVGFSDLATVAVFAWEDRALASMMSNRAAVRQYLDR
jgi:myo-inositol catabolism protein IolH